MSPVQMPRQLQTLDDLLAQAEHYANYSTRNSGRVPTTMFLIGADGPANSADWSAGVLARMLQQSIVSPCEMRPSLTTQYPELTDI